MRENYILFISVGIPIALYVHWMRQKSKDFTGIIEAELKKNELRFVSSTYPGLFKVGPFSRFEISIGKPQINNGAIQYEKSYYRIVEVKTKGNQNETVWAKIETSWFKDTQIEFIPSLSSIQ